MANHPNRFPAHASCGANFAAAYVKAKTVEEESDQNIALRVSSTVTTNRKTGFASIEFLFTDDIGAQAFSIKFPASVDCDLIRETISRAFYKFFDGELS